MRIFTCTAVSPLAAALLLAGCHGTGDMPAIDAHDDVAAEDPLPDPVDEEPGEDPTGDTDEDCVPGQTPTGSAGHSPGMDCRGCHAMSPPYLTVAGTLYTDAAGSLVLTGATVVLTDSAGAEIRLVSHVTGNFFTDAAVAFPATVSVSMCPDAAAMTSAVTDGSCNRCHGYGTRIHLP
jgi:hypothetical protein